MISDENLQKIYYFPVGKLEPIGSGPDSSTWDRAPIEQIQNDIYGSSSHIQKRFAINEPKKLQRALKLCMKEINQGVSDDLVGIANHVPYCLFQQLRNGDDITTIVDNFLRSIQTKLDDIKKQRRDEYLQRIHREV